MINALTNKGIVAIEQNSGVDKSKIVVVGTARGGTSLVAGVLAKLGVFMGAESAHPVYEDLKLSKLFESNDLDAARSVIHQYSMEHAVWGWKRPSCINYLDLVDEVFNKPIYIFIYKDVVSIAQRNAISMRDSVLPAMKRASEQYAESIRFLSDNECHVLLISYDKVLSNSVFFVDSIIDFCGLNPTESARDDAISFITPNPADYLDQSRITRSQGRLGGFDKGVVFGWARYPHPSMTTSAQVELYVNDELLSVVPADIYRKDLAEQFNEDCSFAFNIPDSVTIKKGDVLRAKVVDDIHDLANSPLTV